MLQNQQFRGVVTKIEAAVDVSVQMTYFFSQWKLRFSQFLWWKFLTATPQKFLPIDMWNSAKWPKNHHFSLKFVAVRNFWRLQNCIFWKIRLLSFILHFESSPYLKNSQISCLSKVADFDENFDRFLSFWFLFDDLEFHMSIGSNFWSVAVKISTTKTG